MVVTSLQERVLIQAYAGQGMGDRQIAHQLHLGLSTVRKWRRRSQSGAAGLVSRMGRPTKGALSSFAAEIEQTLKLWRAAHPGWGPKTLLTELRKDTYLSSKQLPSLATITRYLRQAGLARPYQKHASLPSKPVSVATTCHEEWELDARGQEKLETIGVIALINLNDVFSKVKLISYPCFLGAERAHRHPNSEDYQLVLRWAFSEWGLPDRLAVDHDSVFYDNLSKSPFPTRFHLWLLALGIELSFGRKGQPRDQAMTERSHQTWQHQVLEGQSFRSLAALWQALDRRRTFLNQDLPCASLAEQPPLVAHPEARQGRRLYRPEWERDQIEMQRVYAYLEQGHWFRRASNVGAVSLGKTWYTLGPAWAHKEVAIRFDAQDQQLVFQAEGLENRRRPLRKLSAEALMGDLSTMSRVDAYQLPLPISWDEWRLIHTRQLFHRVTIF